MDAVGGSGVVVGVVVLVLVDEGAGATTQVAAATTDLEVGTGLVVEVVVVVVLVDAGAGVTTLAATATAGLVYETISVHIKSNQKIATQSQHVFKFLRKSKFQTFFGEN